MKRSLRIKRVYSLFDCLTGERYGKFYRSKNAALCVFYRERSLGKSVLLEKFREFSGFFRQFECFVRSR